MKENARQMYEARIGLGAAKARGAFPAWGDSDRSVATEYLQQALELDRRIDAGFERIQQLRSIAERRTAVYGREQVRGGGAADARMDVVARIVDAERELDAQIDRMIDLKREIGAVIARVPDERMRGLLELRYLNGHTWEEVAERMHYTTRNVYNLHNAALRAVALLIPPDYREGAREPA